MNELEIANQQIASLRIRRVGLSKDKLHCAIWSDHALSHNKQGNNRLGTYIERYLGLLG